MANFLNTANSFASSNLVGPPQEIRVQGRTVVVKERLAEGGFGFVDLVTDFHSKAEMVLKRCNVATKEALDTVQKEIKILEQFQGPYIVRILGSDLQSVRVGSSGGVEALILLELCPGGHLLNRLNTRKGSFLPQSSIYRIFGQILLAVKSLHDHKPSVIHRDLKLENILFGADGNVRLCDFGSCVFGDTPIRNPEERSNAEEIIEKTTTQSYRSPEMVDLYMRDVLTEKTDIWALGCILYALCFISHPFQDAGSLGILSAKINIPSNSPVSNDTHTIILRMLDIDPEARPSVTQAFEAMSAIATGNSLPPYTLSQEALDRRHQREAAAIKREKATTKKQVAPVVPHRAAPAQIDSNSVAARRLAAKKGITLPSPTPQPTVSSKPTQQTLPSQNSLVDFTPDSNFSGFADFASFPETIPSASVTAASLFDFNEPPAKSSSDISKNSAAELFGFETTSKPASSTTNDSFGDFANFTSDPVKKTATAEELFSFDTAAPASFDAFSGSFANFTDPPASAISQKQANIPTPGDDIFFSTSTVFDSSLAKGLKNPSDFSDDIFTSQSGTQTPKTPHTNLSPNLLDDVPTRSAANTTSDLLDVNEVVVPVTKYSSSTVDVLQMFDTPSSSVKSYSTTSGIVQASPAKPQTLPVMNTPIPIMNSPPMPVMNLPYQQNAMLTPNKPITTMNPAFGRTASSGLSALSPFPQGNYATPGTHLSRSHTTGSMNQPMQPLGLPYSFSRSDSGFTGPDSSYKSNAHRPLSGDYGVVRGVRTSNSPQDPFGTLNIMNPK